MKAKHKISSLLLTALLSAQAFGSDWVDDWFDSATYNSGSTFSTQNRKFITGGGFSVRSQVKTEYPITISMPKISAGCGGIDGFMGGFSFLDADYLVDKAQRMMQAAPYIAVDMALKTMSKEFSDTIKGAENIISQLNSIQLDECRSMKPLVAAAMDRNPEGMKNALGEMVNAKQIRDSSARLWQEATEDIADNKGKVTSDITSEVEGCPADVKEIFGGGSVIKKVADKTTMGGYADLLRGYFGDVVMVKQNNVLVAKPVSACPENMGNVDGFLFGNAYQRTETGTSCTKTTGASVHETIYNKIHAIGTKISTNRALTAEDQAFAGEGTQLPIFKMLQVAYEQGTLEDTELMLADITAAQYASRVTDNFYKAAYDILKRVSDATQNPTQDDNAKPCNMTLYAGAASQVRDILREVRTARQAMLENVSLTINEHSQFLDVVNESRRRLQQVRTEEINRLGVKPQ